MTELQIITNSDKKAREIEFWRNGKRVLYTKVWHKNLVEAVLEAADGSQATIQGSFREPLKIMRRGDYYCFRLSRVQADIHRTDLLAALDG